MHILLRALQSTFQQLSFASILDLVPLLLLCRPCDITMGLADLLHAAPLYASSKQAGSRACMLLGQDTAASPAGHADVNCSVPCSKHRPRKHLRLHRPWQGRPLLRSGRANLLLLQ